MSTLEARQIIGDLYPDKKVVILKLRCRISNLANPCLQKSRDKIFYPSTGGNKDLFEKIRDVVGGPSIAFTYKANFDETVFFRNSTTMFKSIVGIDASQI